jgi:hypothetical protein
MIGGSFALYQFAEPAEQMLQPQVGAYAFIKRVLVKNHSAIFVNFVRQMGVRAS